MARGICVRCGRCPRAGDAFVCDACRTDPQLRVEMDDAARATDQGLGVPDGMAQRRYLIARHNWAGEWPRR